MYVVSTCMYVCTNARMYVGMYIRCMYMCVLNVCTSSLDDSHVCRPACMSF